LRSAPRRWPVLRPFAIYGARASFSLYATHFPVAAFVAGLAVGDRRWAIDTGALAVAAGILILVVSVGGIFAALTEAHTGSLRRWLHGRIARSGTGQAA
jgi:peptidoglycan/LPS O-acetylase OafA/YrhL